VPSRRARKLGPRLELALRADVTEGGSRSTEYVARCDEDEILKDIREELRVWAQRAREELRVFGQVFATRFEDCGKAAING